MGRQSRGHVVAPSGERQRSWAIRFRAYGKRRFVTLGRTEEGWSRRRAERELRHILADVERGRWQPDEPAPPAAEPVPCPTFHEFASAWLRDGAPGWRPKTISDYRWALELHLLPYFARHRLADITIEEVDRYKAAKLREGKLGPNSINKTLTRLAQVLEVAVEYGHIERNPAKGKRRRVKGTEPRRSWVEPEQLPALIDAADIYLRPTIATLAGAGLRIGEAVALDWRDVKLGAGTLVVRESKTAAGEGREVDLPVGLREELATWRARSPRTAPNDPVFRQPRARRPALATDAAQRPSEARNGREGGQRQAESGGHRAHRQNLSALPTPHVRKPASGAAGRSGLHRRTAWTPRCPLHFPRLSASGKAARAVGRGAPGGVRQGARMGRARTGRRGGEGTGTGELARPRRVMLCLVTALTARVSRFGVESAARRAGLQPVLQLVPVHARDFPSQAVEQPHPVLVKMKSREGEFVDHLAEDHRLEHSGLAGLSRADGQKVLMPKELSQGSCRVELGRLEAKAGHVPKFGAIVFSNAISLRPSMRGKRRVEVGRNPLRHPSAISPSPNFAAAAHHRYWADANGALETGLPPPSRLATHPWTLAALLDSSLRVPLVLSAASLRRHRWHPVR